MTKRIAFRVAVCAWLASALTVGAIAKELVIDHVMYRDPEVPSRAFVRQYDPRLKGLWETALRRPESELQRLAADTIAIAHRRGMKDLATLVPTLVQVLNQPELDPVVRRAVVSALIALDAKDQADALVKAAADARLDLHQLVEPALARWGHSGLREPWRQRLKQADTPRRLRLLAIEGLGALHDAESRGPLLELTRDPVAPADLRVAAARAAAQLPGTNYAEESRKLLADTRANPTALTNRIVGVLLLGGQTDDGAIQILSAAAGDSEAAVAAGALERLLAIDPQKVYPLAAAAIQHADANARRVGAQAFLHQGNVPAIETVGALLADPNPGIRRLVAGGLFDLAQKAELRNAVLQVAEKHLAGEDWRGLEQGAMLVGALNHPSAAPRLVALLPHPRQEVGTSTAWALRQLKIPETLPPILEHIVAQQKQHIGNAPTYVVFALSAQFTQLFQLFGELRWPNADPVLQQYIPKMMGLGDSRHAAIWALGKIHEGKPNPALAQKFAGRLSDLDPLMPELDPVRAMSALGIGRLKADAHLEMLRRFSVDTNDAVSFMCYWSVEQFTGEKPPPFEPHLHSVLGWFLQPLDP